MGLPSRFTAPFTRFLSSFSLARPAFLTLVPRLFLFSRMYRNVGNVKRKKEAMPKRKEPRRKVDGGASTRSLPPFSYPTRGFTQKAVNYDLRRYRTLSRTLFGLHRSSSRRENAGGSAYLLGRSAQWKLRYVRSRAHAKERKRDRTLCLFSVSRGTLRFVERKRE